MVSIESIASVMSSKLITSIITTIPNGGNSA